MDHAHEARAEFVNLGEQQVNVLRGRPHFSAVGLDNVNEVEHAERTLFVVDLSRSKHNVIGRCLSEVCRDQSAEVQETKKRELRPEK